jgi:uncharacterized protein YpmS
MKKQISLQKITLLIVLLVFSISCNLIALIKSADETESIVAVQPAAPAVTLPAQAFTYSVTEAQMNEYASAAIASNPDSPVKEPVITLPEGLIEINGKIEQGPLSATVRIVARPYADAEGNLKVELVNADLGAIPLSSGMLDTISVYIEEMLLSSLGSLSAAYRVDSVLITGGVLTLSGQPR